MAHALATTPKERAEGVDPDGTVAFYERNAEDYARRTLASDLSDLYPELLDRLPPGGLVLDAGSGSGRDIRAFLDRGFRVEAFDASSRLAALATELTGVEVAVRRFEDWEPPVARYDGIWCFASLLHVGRRALPAVLAKLASALRPGGWLFASFKAGDEDLIDSAGRTFTNLTEGSARKLFENRGDFTVTKAWQESGPAALGGTTNWLYILAKAAAPRDAERPDNHGSKRTR